MSNQNKYVPHTGEKQIAENKANREKAEAKVLEVRGSYDAPGFEACVQSELAEMG